MELTSDEKKEQSDLIYLKGRNTFFFSEDKQLRLDFLKTKDLHGNCSNLHCTGGHFRSQDVCPKCKASVFIGKFAPYVPTLTLNLYKGWFDMIRKGLKSEEYRAISPYWCQRLISYAGKRRSIQFWKEGFKIAEANNVCTTQFVKDLFKANLAEFEYYEELRCLNGMKPPVPEFNIQVRRIKIGKGRKPLGAEKGKDYFVIMLDEKTVHFERNCKS